jgi:VanZ family protein
MTEIQNTGDRSQLLVYRWASILICCGVIFVIVPTLFPYDFFFSEIFSQLSYDYLLSRVARPDDIYDIIANVFLFIPFGFGIGCLTGKHKLSVKIALVVASFASFGLTFFVEFLQIFLPTRNPSYVDLTTNTTGGLVGFFCFQLFGIQLLKVANIFLSVKILRSKFMAIFMAIAYLCFIIPLSLKLPNKLEL